MSRDNYCEKCGSYDHARDALDCPRDRIMHVLRDAIEIASTAPDKIVCLDRNLAAAIERIGTLESALRLIAAKQRPDGSWNRDREACRRLAEKALKETA